MSKKDWGSMLVAVRYWHLADIDFVPLLGAKRTSLIAWPMSVNDPKRTFLAKTADITVQ
jgi:hypothetical protein